jgi:hypothetical protein
MKTDAEIEAMVRSFEDGSLPHSEWTHASHLLVGLWYLSRHPRDHATRLVRDGIRRYNHVHGRDSGYHETITLAWLAVIVEFLARCDRAQPISVLAEMLSDGCGDKDYLLRYYSRERLMSDEARQTWMPPDRRPIE